MSKSIIWLAALFLIAGLIYFIFQKPGIIHNENTGNNSGSRITNFDECAGTGNPVTESYPRKCSANNKVFTEDIGNELSLVDLIRIDSPRPNNKIMSPLTVTGKARGAWYFEASFPIEIKDANGNLIGSGIAQAQGDWMTQGFVPFTATIEFKVPQTTTGTLILRKDNPSGLPENDNQLIVPVKF